MVHMAHYVKCLNIVIILDAVNVINDKLCMMVRSIELYLCIPLSVTLIVFQGYSGVKH